MGMMVLVSSSRFVRVFEMSVLFCFLSGGDRRALHRFGRRQRQLCVRDSCCCREVVVFVVVVGVVSVVVRVEVGIVVYGIGSAWCFVVVVVVVVVCVCVCLSWLSRCVVTGVVLRVTVLSVFVLPLLADGWGWCECCRWWCMYGCGGGLW